MKNKTYVFALSMGAIIILTVLAGASVVFATTNSYNCTLAAQATCGKSYTAYSFDSKVTSNSAGVYICAGFVISGSITCSNVVTGYGSSFTNSYSQSFSSYYKNTDTTTSTTIGVSDIYCNCFSPP